MIRYVLVLIIILININTKYGYSLENSEEDELWRLVKSENVEGVKKFVTENVMTGCSVSKNAGDILYYSIDRAEIEGDKQYEISKILLESGYDTDYKHFSRASKDELYGLIDDIIDSGVDPDNPEGNNTHILHSMLGGWGQEYKRVYDYLVDYHGVDEYYIDDGKTAREKREKKDLEEENEAGYDNQDLCLGVSGEYEKVSGDSADRVSKKGRYAYIKYFIGGEKTKFLVFKINLLNNPGLLYSFKELFTDDIIKYTVEVLESTDVEEECAALKKLTELFFNKIIKHKKNINRDLLMIQSALLSNMTVTLFEDIKRNPEHDSTQTLKVLCKSLYK